MKPHEVIRALRTELDLTVAQMAERLGLSSKGGLSMIENGKAPISQPVALAIEALSGGRIDAAELNAEVAAARAGFERVAANEDQAASAEIFDRCILCAICERRTDDPAVRSCTDFDCPHAAREAA